MTSKRKTFTKEFKQEAVRLLEQGHQSPVEIARELGVRRNQLYKWQEQIHRRGTEAFPGKGRRSGKDNELAKLKRENDRLKEENEILKKAARYFARESE
ncbi:MAG: transposase [Gammaproteobacteria bacterium]|nr:transposase [Gammaproteobacteria bacterium]